MQKLKYSDNYRRQLVSAFKGLVLWLVEQGQDIDLKVINKVKLPEKKWKTKKAVDMLTGSS